MMGIASKGVSVRSGEPLAIQGLKPTGIAVAGETIWRGGVEQLWQLVAFGSVQGNGTTSVTMDTTGANLFVIQAAYYGFDGLSYLSDNQGNTFMLIGYVPGPINPSLRTWYCLNPNTSGSHTFTATGSYFGLIVSTFLTPSAITLDQTSSVNVTGTPSTSQLPAITPVADSLIVAAAGLNNDSVSLDSGFTIIETVPRSGFFGTAAAYLVTPSNTPLSPILSYSPNWSVSGDNPAYMVSFKPLP